MKLKIIAFFPLLLLSFSLSAQFRFFMEASGNVTLITENKVTQLAEITSDRPDYYLFRTSTYGGSYANKPGVGFTAGFQYFFNRENISLDAGIDFNNVNFHQTLSASSSYFYQRKSDYFIDNKGVPLPELSSKADNHSLYLASLPVSISYYLLENNLSISLGVIPGLLIYSTGGRGASADFSKATAGIQVQLRYQVVDKWWIMAGFQEYSTKLYEASLKQSFSNLRLLKLGVKYDI